MAAVLVGAVAGACRDPNPAYRRVEANDGTDGSVAASDAAGPPPGDRMSATSSLELVAFWDMDEGGGKVIQDGSAYQNTGTLATGVKWVPGRRVSGLGFDGQGAIVSVPSSRSLDAMTGAGTISAWVNLSVASNAWQVVLSRATADGANSQFGVAVWNRVPYVFGATIGQAGSPGLIDLNRWVHVAGTYDGATTRLYVDGIEVAAVARAGGALAPTTAPLVMGGATKPQLGGAPGDLWQGSLDDVSLYARALSADEIRALAQR